MGSIPSEWSLHGGRAGDSGLLEDHCGLYEHASVDGGAGEEFRRRGTKDDSLKVRTSVVGGLTRDDPHDVAGKCAPGQYDPFVAFDAHVPSDLEDPRVFRGATEGAVRGEPDARRELVQAGGKGRTPERARHVFNVVGIDTAGGVGVGDAHVPNGCCHFRRGGGDVVGSV